ncbi:MAG: GHKL domain-containing protein [Bacteroidales bacterium]|nr:GHKL domain-containing protein [Bacteroidales bacterium]
MLPGTHKYNFKRKSLFYFLLSLFFIFASIIYEFSLSKKFSAEKIALSFQEEFYACDNFLISALDSLSAQDYISNNLESDSFIKISLNSRPGFFFFKYYHDTLVYWSDNSVPLSEIFDTIYSNAQVLSLPNGIFYYRDHLIGENRISGLFLIKRIYPYQNIYLENRFHRYFSAPPETSISFSEDLFNIHDREGNFLFSINPPENNPLGTFNTFFLLALYALVFLSLSASIFHLYTEFQFVLKRKLLFILAFSIDIIILRVLMFIFKFPAVLYESEIFSPETFAMSDYIPSLGDFFLNALALLVISYVLFLTFNNPSRQKTRSVFRKNLSIFSLFLHIYIFYRLFLVVAESIVLDSSYSLNLSQIFFLSADSFLALTIFTILLFCFSLISYRILGLAYYYSGKSFAPYFIFLLITSLIYIFICIFIHDCYLLLFIPIVVYIIAFYFFAAGRSVSSGIGFTSIVLYLFLFSILSTSILSYHIKLKEIEQRKLLAIELSSGQDPLTEYLFYSACEEMRSDTHFLSLLSVAPYDLLNEDLAIKYIEDHYLSDRLRRYDWLITLCTPDRSLIIQPDDYLINCDTYFGDLINNIGKQGLGDNIYRFDNVAGNSNYISRQEFILNEGSDTISVFIELFSFFIPDEGLGYPELLIDENIKTFSGLENYSYARYVNDKLVFKYGDYPYRTNIKGYGEKATEVFFHHNNTDHYITKIDDSSYLIISKEEAGFLEIVAPFSYLLLFFTLFLLLFLLIVNFPFTRMHIEFNFRNRLQLYIISIVIVSFLVIGLISVGYIRNLNSSKNEEILREKTHSVLIELEHKLAGAERLTIDMQEYLTKLLIKFSQVFFSDINLYDLKGKLLASSRQQIFQKQLISARMNPDAYRILSVDNKLLFIHTETIGDQDYLSAYVPFMNENNQVVAYLNLPYFAKQTQLQNEISLFLNAFLNVYVLLIALAIFIALLISRYTTRPLQLIKDKMASLSLGGTNEKINWSGKDEIGTLISEYNRMVDELFRSAELLAKSERESAWREMAKQVAHEIKNPLTPMKLSVQYLQKAWEEKSPDWEERLYRFTQTIIEHIDTLSAIASEFSDFAKMPQKKEEKIDLSESIRKSFDLYSDIENISFSFYPKTEGPHFVLADKNQLLSVFNNLIQNSVQAIGQDKEGLIEITLDTDDGNYIIQVRDNGPGIAEDMMDKIFSPSFTTKTSGMGLGLALVRSIIEEAGGEINFESSPEKGTIFEIHLPVYNQ